jgi:hypothetical protein
MEYMLRYGLSQIGYTDDIENVDIFTAHCFGIIATEMMKLQNEAMKDAKKKRGRA